MKIWILSESRLQHLHRDLRTGDSKNTRKFHNILDAFSDTRSGKGLLLLLLLFGVSGAMALTHNNT